MGGAVARVGEDDTAFGNRRATYAYNVNSMWTDASADDLHETMNRGFAEALAPFSTGGVYVNFLGNEGDARKAADCFTEDALRCAVDNIGAAGADELFLVPTTVDPLELDRTRAALSL